MTTTTIKKLSALNVAAITETITDPRVTTTKTTATFDMTPAEAYLLVERTMTSLGRSNAHPRKSLIAVKSRLLKVVEAEAAPMVDATPEPVADEFPTMAITPEQFADALLADMLNLDTPEETPAADTINGVPTTPAMRAVYDAMSARDASDATAKDMVDATGIILPKVRAALQALKAAGAVASTDQSKPGQSVVWWLTRDASLRTTDEAAVDADIAVGAEIDAAVESTGHMPGNGEPEAGWNSTVSPGGDDDTQPPTDAPQTPADDTDDDEGDDAPAQTVDAPQAPRTAPRRVRLLAAYPNDPAPSAGSGGKGKQMGPILEFLKQNPGVEYTVREVQHALSLPDYPSAAHERLAADPSTGVSRVDHGNRKKFVYNPVA